MSRGRVQELNLAAPPEVLKLEMGDTCRVYTQFNYSGPPISATLYVAIGRVGVLGFDELLTKSKSLSIPATPETKTYESYVDIYITSPMKVATGYDLYAKLMKIPGYPDVFSPTYENIIDIIEEIPPPGYSLEVTIEPPGYGRVTVSPSKTTYSPGERVTLTATAYSGYEFDHWGGDAYGMGTSRTITITMDKDMWVVAAFREKAVAQYTLTISVSPAGAGTVTPPSGSTYPSGASVSLLATAYSGYQFERWGGDASGTSPTTTITMTRNKSVVAYFKEVVVPPPPPEIVWYPPGKITQIGILAPSSAPSGTVVDVEVLLKNILSFDVNMWPGRTRYNDTIFRVYDAAGAMHVVVPAGATHSWFGSFTMPNRDIRILVESWFERLDKWYADYNVRQTVRRS